MRYLYNGHDDITPTSETPHELYNRLYKTAGKNTAKKIHYEVFERVMSHPNSLFIHPELLAAIENENAFVPVNNHSFDHQKLSNMLIVLHHCIRVESLIVIVRITYQSNQAINLHYRTFEKESAVTLIRKGIISEFLADNP